MYTQSFQIMEVGAPKVDSQAAEDQVILNISSAISSRENTQRKLMLASRTPQQLMQLLN